VWSIEWPVSVGLLLLSKIVKLLSGPLQLSYLPTKLECITLLHIISITVQNRQIIGTSL